MRLLGASMLLVAGAALLVALAPLQVAASPSEEAIEAAVAKMLGNMTVAQKARQLVYGKHTHTLTRAYCCLF